MNKRDPKIEGVNIAVNTPGVKWDFRACKFSFAPSIFLYLGASPAVVERRNRDGTRIAEKRVNINWQHTFRDTLVAFRDAVLRYAHGMRRLYANRKHTNLTAVVSDKDRARFSQLIAISQDGSSSINPTFQNRIDAAERAAPRAH